MHLNLLELDGAAGSLTVRGRIPIDGILPEEVTFDAAGNYVAATVFDHFDPTDPTDPTRPDPTRRRGSLQFFAVARDDCPNLVRTNATIEVPPGPHTVAIVP